MTLDEIDARLAALVSGLTAGDAVEEERGSPEHAEAGRRNAH
jgi:hypothetical protein